MVLALQCVAGRPARWPFRDGKQSQQTKVLPTSSLADVSPPAHLTFCCAGDWLTAGRARASVLLTALFRNATNSQRSWSSTILPVKILLVPRLSNYTP